MSPTVTSSTRLLSIEWTDVSWFDLSPRLLAGQLPATARLFASGAMRPIAPGHGEAWDLFRVAANLRTAGFEFNTHGRFATAVPGISAEEIDPRIFQFFPPDETARPLLMEALTRLYTNHNAVIAALDERPGARIFDVCYTLPGDVARAYERSPCLPEARLAAFRLLDLLFGDLRHCAGSTTAVYFRSSGPAAEPGTCAFHSSSSASARQPAMPAEGALPVLIATLLGIAPSVLSPTGASDAPLGATWLQPQIPPASRLDPAPTTTDESRIHVRPARPSDRLRINATFPANHWPDNTDGFLGFSDSSETRLLAAASVNAKGGLTFLLANHGSPAALPVLGSLIERARSRALTTLINLNEIPSGDPREAALHSAGFQVFGEVTLWKLPVAAMLRRARRMKPATGRWTWRPVTPADIARWLVRPETRALLSPDVEFAPDLSVAVEKEGQPAGLVLIKRIDRVAVLNLLVVSDEVRAVGGGIEPLMMRGPLSLHLAGIKEIIFTTDDTRREAVAFARRCDGISLRKNLRFRLAL